MADITPTKFIDELRTVPNYAKVPHWVLRFIKESIVDTISID